MEHKEESCRTLDEIAELYGVNPWTIRLWVDRLNMGHITYANDGMRFAPRAVEQIGVLCRLVKKKMKLEEVCKYLESEFSDRCEQ
jgi:DNA-binding transcriptional MerR regulator